MNLEPTYFQHSQSSQPENNAQQPTPDPPQRSFEDDFFHRPINHVVTMPPLLRIHLLIATLISTGSLGLWKLTSEDVMVSPWWWMYPVFFFGITLTLHHEGRMLKKGIIVAFIVNVALYFTVTRILDLYYFFLYLVPWYVTGAVSMGIYYRAYPDVYSWLKLVTHEYILLSVFLIAFWTHLDGYASGFPFFFIPVLILGLIPFIMYLRKEYNERRAWVYITLVCLDIAINVFFTWVFTVPIFPWFLFAWVPLGLIASVAWFMGRRNNNHVEIIDEESPVQP
eukprot:TRINITY_DN962_c0_g1_i3.p1 TRINITY_DN962_c0_g1~~TRINITY_DN962_c0_g1_i3.p1  ORF type:complete len:299 (-),score=35.76 TRINITY_DN962_c0_g1_i3:720-1562(-)